METHVKVLGVIHIVLGGLVLLAGVIGMVVFGSIAPLIEANVQDQPDAELVMPLIALAGGILVIVALILAIPAIVAGVGLLKFREWARILTIVLSALNLLNIPIGTALGAYGLWVLLSARTQPLFRQPAAAL